MKLLHVGCGGSALPDYLKRYEETRLDIDAQHQPDVLASITDMGDIGQYEALYCAHVLEHLYPHECEQALAEFLRILKPRGAAVIFVPDLEDVKPDETVLFQSPAGDITGLDLIYGHRMQIKDNPHMAHKNGFVKSTLEKALKNAGFKTVTVSRHKYYNLSALAIK